MFACVRVCVCVCARVCVDCLIAANSAPLQQRCTKRAEGLPTPAAVPAPAAVPTSAAVPAAAGLSSPARLPSAGLSSARLSSSTRPNALLPPAGMRVCACVCVYASVLRRRENKRKRASVVVCLTSVAMIFSCFFLFVPSSAQVTVIHNNRRPYCG